MMDYVIIIVVAAILIGILGYGFFKLGKDKQIQIIN